VVARQITIAADVDLSVEVVGVGAPLVLIAGAEGNSSTWDPVWPHLSSIRRCVRYDLRGCGESRDQTSGAFRHATDLAVLLDRLGIERATVAGVSMGGRIALDFALDHPDRSDRLILISPNLAGWDWSLDWQQRWLQISTVARDGLLDRARDLWLHHPLFTTARRNPALAARLRAEIAADNCRAWLDADRETPPQQPHVERLTELTVPVLLITGHDDLNDFRVMAEILVAMVGDICRVDLDGTGHLAHLERPVETIHAITTFLTETATHPVNFGCTPTRTGERE
jgi:2-succinyl-6-hydroxy-2,4-cyclohexadiene-1-carboxylate synthase